jgi:DeoR family transcriptional regulator, aga operon transcriptional repressor
MLGSENAGRAGQDRLLWVLNEIRRSGSIEVNELMDRTGASGATIRRALSKLEKNGLVLRRRGRAEAAAPVLYSFIRDSSFQKQVGHMAEEKRRIGLVAASLIKSGDVVAFGPGTTTTAAACSILPNVSLRVVTNALNIAFELRQRKSIRLFLTGGDLRESWFSLVGQTAVESAKAVVADIAFVGVTGIDPEHGLTDDHPEESAVTRVMLAQAKRRIVVADHTKFGKVSYSRVWPLDKIDIIITDRGVSKRISAPYEAKGVKILRG